MITKNIDKPFSIGESPYQAMNAAGLIDDVRICPADWLEELEVRGDGRIAIQRLSLKPGRVWIVLSGVHGSAIWDVKSKTTAHGKYYEHGFGLDLSMVRPSVLSWLNMFGEVPFAILFRDRNGYARLVGDVERPVDLEMVATTGKRAGKNMTKIDLKAVTIGNIGYYVSEADDIAAMIGAMQDAAYYQVQLATLIDRIEALEAAQVAADGVVFKVFTYIFDDSSHVVELADGFVADLSKPVMLMSLSVNGVTLNGRINFAYAVFLSEFDDAVILRGSPNRVHLNPNTVGLVDENIIKILVRIG